MTSANKDPESSATNESEENKKTKGEESALDPNPSKALTELVTGDETTTSTNESSSKGA